MAFNSDTTDVSANSFVTVADADAYFADRFGFPLWPTDSKTKKQLLLTASQRINREIFNGETTTDLRLLQFPKKGLYDRFGDAILETIVPDEIRYAVFLQAYSYLREGLFSEDELEDLSTLTSMSESTELGSRSYSFKKLQIDLISKHAINQLKIIPNLWQSGKLATFIRR